MITALCQWCEHHAFAPGEPYRPLIDRTTGKPLRHLTCVRPDGSPVGSDAT